MGDLNGLMMHWVNCQVYYKIKGKEKLLTLKLDNLLKHKGRKKAIIAIPCICKARELYMKMDSTHAKNEVHM